MRRAAPAPGRRGGPGRRHRGGLRGGARRTDSPGLGPPAVRRAGRRRRLGRVWDPIGMRFVQPALEIQAKEEVMGVIRSKKWLVALAGVIVTGIVAAVAIPAVLSQQVVIDATTAHFRIVKTAADGFDSGWHVHPGVAIVQVQHGAFQIYQASCTPRTVSAGDTFIEIPYEPVRAVATGRIVWTRTLITNQGALAW